MARILVIDDDGLACFTVERILAGAGHTVVLAENGAVGMRRQRETPFDLVITDILMPERDGIETIRTLKAEFPRLRIIAISGGGRVGNLNFLQMAEDFGVADTLPKPFSADALLAKVAGVLGA